jgi:hypothetical protein
MPMSNPSPLSSVQQVIAHMRSSLESNRHVGEYVVREWIGDLEAVLASLPQPVQQELEKALKEVRVYLVNNGWGDHHGQTYMRRVQKHLLTASTILAALPQPEGLIAAVQELRKRLDQWDDKQSTIAALIAENNVWGAARAVAEYASQLSAASLPSGWQPIDVEAMRANLHATFNGGHQKQDTIRAFHHGMDTVCNVLAAYQKREQTNGILPAPPRPPAPAGEGQKP